MTRPEQPVPAEHVWTLARGDEVIWLELRNHGDRGCELRLSRNGHCIFSQRWNTRVAALEDEAARRQALEREGFTLDRPARGAPAAIASSAHEEVGAETRPEAVERRGSARRVADGRAARGPRA